MKVFWKVFKKFLQVILLIFVLFLAHREGVSAQYRIPFPSRIAVPTIPQAPPIPKPLGFVELYTQTIGCGNMKTPVAASFLVCKNPPDLTPIRYQQEPNCVSLNTNSEGIGGVSVAAGNYTMVPPTSCPPGAMCITKQSAGSRIWNPYSWTVEPQDISVNGGGLTSVKALQTNHRLLCPISLTP